MPTKLVDRWATLAQLQSQCPFKQALRRLTELIRIVLYRLKGKWRMFTRVVSREQMMRCRGKGVEIAEWIGQALILLRWGVAGGAYHGG